MSVFSTLNFIVNHPLNRNASLAAVIHWLRWQLGSRLISGEFLYPFVNDAILLIRPGMTGATGNLYTGLHEFEDMAFVLHLLRPTDLFIDVGANVGSYTVLAGAAIGASCIAIEPIPTTFQMLRRNVVCNGVQDKVEALNIGIGQDRGKLRFTRSFDTVNHVLEGTNNSTEDSLEVEVRALDEVVGIKSPVLVKIDVEGFETPVITGAEQLFSGPQPDAVIMELNGSGRRYGFDEDALHQKMINYGFATFNYRPFERVLIPLYGERANSGNTLYIRNLEWVRERLRTAPMFRVRGQVI